MAEKEQVIFQPSGETKRTIKTEPVGVFRFCFQFWKASKSLTYFAIFVTIYLKIVENIDQMHESTFSDH